MAQEGSCTGWARVGDGADSNISHTRTEASQRKRTPDSVALALQRNALVWERCCQDVASCAQALTLGCEGRGAAWVLIRMLSINSCLCSQETMVEMR